MDEGGSGHVTSSLIFPNYRLLVFYDFLLIFSTQYFFFIYLLSLLSNGKTSRISLKFMETLCWKSFQLNYEVDSILVELNLTSDREFE